MSDIPDPVYNNTHEFGHRLVDELIDEYTDGKNVLLPEHIPKNQYATTCLAVASYRSGQIRNSPELIKKSEDLLGHYESLDESKKGHSEFNTFALLELVGELKKSDYVYSYNKYDLENLLDFNTSFYHRSGNNWKVLKQLCVKIYQEEYENYSLWNELDKTITNYLIKTWKKDGLFVDEPRYPFIQSQTPLTYHAKATMCLSRLLKYDEYDWVEDFCHEYLERMQELQQQNGRVIYYGRSEDTIFGISSLISAIFYHQLYSNKKNKFEELKRKSVHFMLKNYEPKEISCYPTKINKENKIDRYVYDAVYCAYAAMILLDLPKFELKDINDKSEQIKNVNRSGDLRLISGESSSLGFSQVGQIRYLNDSPDFRYAGLIPHTYQYKSQEILPGVPHRYDIGTCAPFLPILKTNDTRVTPIKWNNLNSNYNCSSVQVQSVGELYPINSRFFQSGVKRNPVNFDNKSRKVMNSMKSIAKLSGADLLNDRIRHRKKNIGVRCDRYLHYELKNDLLVIITKINSKNKTSIQYSSIVVTRGNEEKIKSFYSHEIKNIQKLAKNSTNNCSVIKTKDSIYDNNAWSIIIIDPRNKFEATATIKKHKLNVDIINGNTDRLYKSIKF